MKRFFLGAFALMFLTVISCKDAANKAEEATEEAVEEVAEKVEEAAEEVAEKVEAAVDGVPNFSDDTVQEYVNAYEAYMAEYAKIVESKDMTAFAGLSSKASELGQKSQEIAGKLTGEDAEKFTAYMTAKAEQAQELAKKLTQQ